MHEATKTIKQQTAMWKISWKNKIILNIFFLFFFSYFLHIFVKKEATTNTTCCHAVRIYEFFLLHCHVK